MGSHPVLLKRTMTTIAELPTPALLLDQHVLEGNLQRMARRAEELGVSLRPHIKSHKCAEIAERQRALGARGITVATLPEARAFAEHGFEDITWAFPLILNRLDEVLDLAKRVTLRLVVDSSEAIYALERAEHPFHVWLEVDCGYHRVGVDPQSLTALELARTLHGSDTLDFDGILTHSGHAYQGRTREDIARVATQERQVMVEFADRLRAEGVRVDGVSVGSTPALAVVDHLEGVTEARPGNYALHDYTQVLLGTCTPRECAVTVLASVVSSQPGSKHSVTDAGALALSKDTARGPAPQPTMGEIYQDYAAGTLRPDARLVSLSQEHGMVSKPLPVGSRVRILPNHACLAVSCFDRYHVVQGDEVVDTWRIWRER
ncbi:MAG: DSD1 family PLP-dependent enzyme [Gemmatimonadales bacterium]|nr:DSD1 family PLP-dependent enzyme [Gemmatimonadales bacterium]